MVNKAFVAPILPGKTEQWKNWMGELNGPRKQEYMDARQKYGFRERAFFQPTPQGDYVIITLEGDDPIRSFRDWALSGDPFAQWFVQNVKDIHGFDVGQLLSGPEPQMVLDSGPITGTMGQRRAA